MNINKFFKLLLILFLFCTVCYANESEGNKMTKEEICKENFNKLFLAEPLGKNGTDPEFMAILQKYIFGEVFTIGELDIKTRELVTITVLGTLQTLPQLNAHINAALNIGVTPIEIREAMYQLAPFIGFPKSLNAINTMNEVFQKKGIKLPLEDTTTTKDNERYEKGFEIQNPIYGDEIKQSLKNLPNNVGDDVSRFLTEVCFGDFYTRGGLDIKTRELLTIAILTATGDKETLKAHIKGNIKVGNNKETIAAVIVQSMPYTGFPNAIMALKTLKEAK